MASMYAPTDILVCTAVKASYTIPGINSRFGQTEELQHVLYTTIPGTKCEHDFGRYLVG